VANGRRADFEAAFGLGGSWPSLLTRADGYLKTEMWCESPNSVQYRVRDFWSWHPNFEIFRARFQAEIEGFENWLHSKKVVEKNQFLGAYYERFDEGSDEDLILS
jgi:hypothetical protein